MLKTFQVGLAALLCAGSACAPSEHRNPSANGPIRKSKSAERIDSANDPSLFQLTMRTDYASLPTSGESLRKPFPSNWWPMRSGGIARRWNGNDLSPAEKYDLLVFPNQVRSVSMTLAKTDWKGEPVNEEAEPDNFTIGPAAEWEHRNHGRYGFQDPDSWWGHCNGWASYVLNEEEPTRAVRVRFDDARNRVFECSSSEFAGCVTFEVGDINALGAEIYWMDAARMLGRRCEQSASDFNFDASGRISSEECRDGNAASFHIVASNMLGLMARPFVVDKNLDQAVWNYPVYRFELSRNEEISVEEALREIDAPSGTYSWIYNSSAERFVRVQMKTWIVEDAIPPSTTPTGNLVEQFTTIEYYDYILELDYRGNIVGGEWVGEDKTYHPDFLWYSFGNASDGVSSDDQWDADNPSLRYSLFKQILTAAQGSGSWSPPPPPPPPPSPPPSSGGVLRLTSNPMESIPDDDSMGLTSDIYVSDSFLATHVSVTVSITHGYTGDLILSLVRDGQEYTLSQNRGGGSDNLYETYDVRALIGRDVRGTWSLRVVDTSRQDTGTLNTWSIELGRPSGGGGGSTGGGGSGGGGGGGGGSGTIVTREFSSAPGLDIPDNDSWGLESTISIGEAIRIDALRVEVDITHTYIADLQVVVSNGSSEQVLHSNGGGGSDDLRRSFDTAAFRNTDARGTWTLRVIDSSAQDVGTLDAWKLVVTGARF